LGSQDKTPLLNSLDNIFYSTNNFINKNQLLNKTLVFKKQDGSFEALASVRDDETTGSTTTY